MPFDPYYDDYSHPSRHISGCRCTGCRQMWGEAWHRDIPKRKPNQGRKLRRITIIRSAWQHVHDYEDWVYPIHRLWHDQRSIMHDFYFLRRRGFKPLETTQVRLSFID